MIGLKEYLFVGLIIFLVGLYGAITRRNAIGILMGIELMLNAANLNLVAFSSYLDSVGINGQVFVIFVITIAACEAAVGLALILAIYRHIKTIQVEKMNILKW
jgi:NADH:ubiquinone oxidoreductase subunit K